MSMDALYTHRLVPVVTVDSETDAVAVAQALCAGGLPVIEITLRTPRALAAIAAVREAQPDMLVGAGTILSPEQARAAIDAGAQFGVAPGCSPRVILEAVEYSLPFIPGVQTATDIETALANGCKLLKFFPAVPAGGTAMLKALAGPYQHHGVRFVPLGGVTLEQVPDWLQLACVAAVGGSWLVTAADVAARDWGAITRKTREALAVIQAV